MRQVPGRGPHRLERVMVAMQPFAGFAGIPPAWPEDLRAPIRSAHQAGECQLVVLDDDPTGTQSVHNVAVVTRWDPETLQAEFARDKQAFFILTNSRSLSPHDARLLMREVAVNVRSSAAVSNRRFVPLLRGDSTLRGHFPLEVEVLQEECGPFDGVLLAPFFSAGGRLTLDGIHYVVENGNPVPVAATAFARDPTFGYRSSNLRHWVEEKTAGRVTASAVQLISLGLIREGGPSAVSRALLDMPKGAHVVVDALERADLDVVALASLQVEAQGRRYLYRTASDFVASRLGMGTLPLLDETVLSMDGAASGGLIVVGSYVPKTTEQLACLRAEMDVVEVELDVEALLDPEKREALLLAASAEINSALLQGRDALLFTSRKLVMAHGSSGPIVIQKAVSQSLVSIVANLKTRPRFLISKGGITSSDVATCGLEVRRCLVMGQLIPGVPVWRLGVESKFPGMAYVVFPGNVGTVASLKEAVTRLRAGIGGQ